MPGQDLEQPNFPQRGGLTPGPAVPAGDDDEEGFDFGRLWSAVGRYRLLIATLTIGGAAAGFGLSKLVRPVYEAQASVQVPVVVRGGPIPEMLRAAPILEGRGWLELMRSFEVLDEVVRRKQLFLEVEEPALLPLFAGLSVSPQLVPGEYQVVAQGFDSLALLDATGAVLERVALGDSLGLALGVRWAPTAFPARQPVPFRLRMPRDASVRLSNDLSTILPPEGSLLRISFRSVDPGIAASTVNAVADRFVEVAMLLKRSKLTTVTETLRDQVANAREDLTRAEQALESFKVNTITQPTDRDGPAIASGLSETRDPVRQAFFALKTDREALARDRDALRRALAMPADSLRNTVVALGVIPSVRETRELMVAIDELTQRRGEARQARLIYSPERPEVVQAERQVAELEQRTVPTLAAALLENLEQRVRDLDQRIAASSREMQQIPVRVTEENRLERDVAVSQTIYTELQSAYEQARLQELSATADVRVLDLAVPPTRPVRDQMLIILVGGFAGGLGLGLFLAIGMDRFDPRIRYPEQVTRQLGLAILGAVPAVRKNRAGRHNLDDEAALLEAVRSIRMSLLYAHGTAGPFLTTITSPGPGDGKSFLSRHLAHSFAVSGRRTLLIDGDNRRGQLHRTVGIQRRPGLMDVVMGRVAIEDAIARNNGEGFDLLPCGIRRANAPELLASRPMQELILRLRSEYEAIVVDSPPMGAGVDPLVLASLSGTLVLVLRSGQTNRAMAEAKLHDLDRLPVRLLGAVLNDVRAEGAYRYYSYLPGYRAFDEDEAGGAEGLAARLASPTRAS